MSSLTIKELPCPDAATLRRFLNDELSGPDAVPLNQHIDSCPACQKALERLVGGLPGPFGIPDSGTQTEDTAFSSVADNRQSPIPPQVPGYEVLAELGRGGMGVVYKAQQVRPERIVALKMLLAGGHAGPKERARFLHEAEAVAHLQHPHIVPLYEVGEHDGLPYFTMEYSCGGSLADLLRGTPLPPQDAAPLVEKLARGMHYAHERGIVHRDLKPANILLQRATSDSAPPSTVGKPQAAIPKISDFGLAKNLADAAALTSTGAIFGTPSYMAPEQASGDIKQVGAADDVYALGAVLYECLTGMPPFRGVTPADTVLQVLRSEPSAPSVLQRGVQRDLDTICLKCLEKEPRRRYGSALDLADDLRRFQAGEPIRARPVGRVERVVKWCRRRPAVAALLAAVVLLTLAAGSLVTWQWRQAVTALAELQSEKKARAQRQAAALADASPARVPAILEELAANRAEVLPLLRQMYEDEKEHPRRMRLALFLLPVAPEMRQPLTDWMLKADDPAEVLLARHALRPYGAELIAQLWAKVEDARTPADVRFRALAALAAYDPDDPRWQKVGPQVGEDLLGVNPLHRILWAEAFRPVGPAVWLAPLDASYYPLKVGTKWHYRTETSNDKKWQRIEQIVKIEMIDGLALARHEAIVKGEVVGTTMYLRSTARGVFLHRMDGQDFSPPLCLLKFPVKPGESWDGEVKMGEYKLKTTCRVGSEEVEVPLGKHKAIIVQIEFVDKVGWKSGWTFWFAAGKGVVKKTITSASAPPVAVAAGTVGLAASPFGDGPFLVVSALFPRKTPTVTQVLEKFEEGK